MLGVKPAKVEQSTPEDMELEEDSTSASGQDDHWNFYPLACTSTWRRQVAGKKMSHHMSEPPNLPIEQRRPMPRCPTVEPCGWPLFVEYYAGTTGSIMPNNTASTRL
ncbi:hypothetical protein EV126DRAFT_53988 [Verticillium dahliae]|nr:hypothetical protein EV126DRAFT_53988 [Verticillium dahliae]